ncbi:hypothetical protein DUPY_01100 [Duganella phyllosphaerae]|uniref:Uncharacterized protein n=1 Tax=Duganella phyllosphaerae TaxID=762836 RepID=A0A1E7X7W1_9BURK|nr:hypothetical protein DUPY_01100 [Duganella phyllosphaerae]
MHQRVGDRLAEGAQVHLGYGHAEQTDLYFTLGIVRAEIRLQPVQRLKQREAAKFVEADRLARQHLEREFMRANQFAQRQLFAQQQHARQRGHAGAIALARGQSKRAIKRFVIEFKQHAVAAILLHALAQAFALQRIQVTELGASNRLSGSIHQAKGGGATGTVMRQHRHAFGLAVGLQAPAQIHAAGGRHFAMRLGYDDARHLHSAQRDRRDHDRQRRRCARGHQSSQSGQLHMFDV